MTNLYQVQDFDKESVTYEYKSIASCELLRVNDALATVEEMTLDTSTDSIKPFDIVFVDADKTRLMEYVDAVVSNDRVLKKGGLIVVDNVLWKGLVLDASGSDIESGTDDELSLDSSTKLEKELVRKNRRARKLANKMHRFNNAVVRDDRVEVLLMPLRDGLSLIRKK
jgi:predicted O-methyltransferase YrrM